MGAPEIGILLLMGIARGLEVAHAADVVHRDIRPANVLLGRTGTPRLADFGTALVVGNPRLTRWNPPDPPAYRAPEMQRGPDANIRTDMYALGVTACQILTQNLPHQSESGASLLTGGLNSTLDPAKARQAEHKAAVARLVNTMLAGQPQQRYQSCGEFLANARQTLRELDPCDSLNRHEADYLALFARTVFAEHPGQRAAALDERLSRAALLWPTVDASSVSELSACLRQASFLGREDPRVLEIHRRFDKLLQTRPELLPGSSPDSHYGAPILGAFLPTPVPGRVRALPKGRRSGWILWTPLLTGVEHMEIQRRTYPHVEFETIANVMPDAGAYAVSGLTPGLRYGFRLRCVTHNGISEWSNEAVPLRAGSIPGWLLGAGLGLLLLLLMGALWWMGRK